MLMLAVLALSGAELFFLWTESLRPWMVFPISIVNIWGYTDAVLRFPVIHQIDSFFTVKNLVLLAFKVAMLAFGFRKLDIVSNACLMVFLMVMNVLGLPALYFAALPVEATVVQQRLAAHDVNDVDMAQNAYLFATDASHRKECLATMRRCMPRVSDKMLISPVVKEVITVLSPMHRKPISTIHRKAI